MNLIEQLQTDVARHQRQLEERLAELKAEMVETRKVLTSVTKYRARLGKQHPNGEASLPLAPPDDEEEEATDEPLDPDSGEPLMPDERGPDYEWPEESEAPYQTPEGQPFTPEPEAPAEPEKPVRRRKAKAAAEEATNG